MTVTSPLYRMPSRSILRLQQNRPDMDGPLQPFVIEVIAATQLSQSSHSQSTLSEPEARSDGGLELGHN